jgi:transcriptional regulator with XRE-family HTH domain
MKYKEKILALKLRKNGLSYSEILKKMDVSKSTLSVWLREIELTNEQKNQLLNKMDKSRYEVAKRKVADRKKRTEEIVRNAKKEVSIFCKEPLFFVGLALYWAEGAKNPTEKVKFANSDERMILLMMKWFRKVCKVPEKKFKIHIHMHTLHIRKDIITYWSELTRVPESQFYRPYIKKTSLGQRRNILYNGTCSIMVHDKNLFRRIVGWKLGLQEHFAV